MSEVTRDGGYSNLKDRGKYPAVIKIPWGYNPNHKVVSF